MIAALLALVTTVPMGRAGAPDPGPSPADSTVARVDSTAVDSTLSVRFGGFVDVYYAIDFQRPPALDRAFTTAAARHNEFNVNLAFVEAAVSGHRVRGRFAVQAGTSVQANYRSEPRVGQVSGSDLSRFIQEAFVGYQVRDGVWLDAGVFFAPFGPENWISRDNPVYTRSLVADNSPYYGSGLRIAWQVSPVLQVQSQLLNGWQNMSETNEDKAIAWRADWKPVLWLCLSYATFLGNEQPDSVPSRLRQFHEAIVRWDPSTRTTIRAALDYGRQPRVEAAGGGTASWRGFTVLARHAVSPTVGVGARVERYSDPEQVIVTTGLARGLRATGVSFNADAALHHRVVWRTEIRALRAREAVLPAGRHPSGHARGNAVVVSSVAFTF